MSVCVCVSTLPVSALTADTVGTSWGGDMSKMHLKQLRQIAYRGAWGVQQRQAIGDLWHNKCPALRGHGGSGWWRTEAAGPSDGTVLVGAGVSVFHEDFQRLYRLCRATIAEKNNYAPLW